MRLLQLWPFFLLLLWLGFGFGTLTARDSRISVRILLSLLIGAALETIAGSFIHCAIPQNILPFHFVWIADIILGAIGALAAICFRERIDLRFDKQSIFFLVPVVILFFLPAPLARVDYSESLSGRYSAVADFAASDALGVPPPAADFRHTGLFFADLYYPRNFPRQETPDRFELPYLPGYPSFLGAVRSALGVSASFSLNGSLALLLAGSLSLIFSFLCRLRRFFAVSLVLSVCTPLLLLSIRFTFPSLLTAVLASLFALTFCDYFRPGARVWIAAVALAALALVKIECLMLFGLFALIILAGHRPVRPRLAASMFAALYAFLLGVLWLGRKAYISGALAELFEQAGFPKLWETSPDKFFVALFVFNSVMIAVGTILRNRREHSAAPREKIAVFLSLLSCFDPVTMYLSLVVLLACSFDRFSKKMFIIPALTITLVFAFGICSPGFRYAFQGDETNERELLTELAHPLPAGGVLLCFDEAQCGKAAIAVSAAAPARIILLSNGLNSRKIQFIGDLVKKGVSLFEIAERERSSTDTLDTVKGAGLDEPESFDCDGAPFFGPLKQLFEEFFPKRGTVVSRIFQVERVHSIE